MVLEKKRREKRKECWIPVYKVHGSTMRPHYKIYRKEETEWLMDNAIKYKKEWKTITKEYNKRFPDHKLREGNNSLYSKWSRECMRLEGKFHQKNPALLPKHSGQGEMAGPKRRAISAAKNAMITEANAIYIQRSKDKSKS